MAVLRWRIEEDHQIAKQATGLDAGQVIRWRSWHRWTAICLLAYIYLAIAAAVQRQHDPSPELAGLIPITAPNCCGCCAARSSHRAGGTGPTNCTRRIGGDATSTTPAKPTNVGTPTPRLQHDHNELQPP